jgi:hypothetical protein
MADDDLIRSDEAFSKPILGFSRLGRGTTQGGRCDSPGRLNLRLNLLATAGGDKPQGCPNVS